MDAREEQMLGHLLVQSGVLTLGQLEAGLDAQQARGRTGSSSHIADILVGEGLLSAEIVARALAYQRRLDLACPACQERTPARTLGTSFAEPFRCPSCGGSLAPPSISTLDAAATGTLELAAGEKDPLIGRQLGQCRILGKIGQGGMGSVYRGRHLNLDIDVAVKIMSRELAGGDGAFERFQREAKATAKLDHPNIVRVLNVGQEGELHFIVMQFIKGQSLRERIVEQGRLAPERALDIALQVARGLAEAHRQGVVHRDIKPDNILLTEKGKVKITDFGLAKAAGDHDLTLAGQILGTPYYLAPEQGSGQSVDGRADLYSLGVTLFHMLTGVRPYEAASPMAIVYMHINDPVPDPRGIVKDLPPALSAVVRRLMAKRPAERYGDAQALADELEAAIPLLTQRDPAQGTPRPGSARLAAAEGAADREAINARLKRRARLDRRRRSLARIRESLRLLDDGRLAEAGGAWRDAYSFLDPSDVWVRRVFSDRIEAEKDRLLKEVQALQERAEFPELERRCDELLKLDGSWRELRLLRETARVGQGRIAELRERAQALAGAGKLEEARGVWEDLARYQTLNAESHSRILELDSAILERRKAEFVAQVQQHVAAHRYAEAEEALREADKLGATDQVAELRARIEARRSRDRLSDWVRSALTADAEERHEEARELAQRILEVEPQQEAALHILAHSGKRLAEKSLAEAGEALKAGDLLRARSSLQAALAAAPAHARASSLLQACAQRIAQGEKIAVGYAQTADALEKLRFLGLLAALWSAHPLLAEREAVVTRYLDSLYGLLEKARERGDAGQEAEGLKLLERLLGLKEKLRTSRESWLLARPRCDQLWVEAQRLQQSLKDVRRGLKRQYERVRRAEESGQFQEALRLLKSMVGELGSETHQQALARVQGRQRDLARIAEREAAGDLLGALRLIFAQVKLAGGQALRPRIKFLVDRLLLEAHRHQEAGRLRDALARLRDLQVLGLGKEVEQRVQQCLGQEVRAGEQDLAAERWDQARERFAWALREGYQDQGLKAVIAQLQGRTAEDWAALADRYFDRGGYGPAEAAYRQAIAGAQGARRGALGLRLGECLLCQDREQEAQMVYRQALTDLEASQSWPELARALRIAAEMARASGDEAGAEDLSRRALEAAHKAGDRGMRYELLRDEVVLARARGQREVLRKGLAEMSALLAAQGREDRERAAAACELARLDLEDGRPLAPAALHDAAQLAWKAQAYDLALAAEWSLGERDRAAGQGELARGRYKQVLARMPDDRRSGETWDRMLARQAELALAAGDLEGLEAAEQLARELGSRGAAHGPELARGLLEAILPHRRPGTALETLGLLLQARRAQGDAAAALAALDAIHDQLAQRLWEVEAPATLPRPPYDPAELAELVRSARREDDPASLARWAWWQFLGPADDLDGARAIWARWPALVGPGSPARAAAARIQAAELMSRRAVSDPDLATALRLERLGGPPLEAAIACYREALPQVQAGLERPWALRLLLRLGDALLAFAHERGDARSLEQAVKVYHGALQRAGESGSGSDRDSVKAAVMAACQAQGYTSQAEDFWAS